MTTTTFAAQINSALDEALTRDPAVLVYGLGVTDPKAVFGTTKDLAARHGPMRVFDMPTSENAMTGIAVGAAIGGLRPVLTHQRLDFALLSMDQIVNNAAKWRFMFGGRRSCPITIRMIIGRGWGQGPTHSQSLQAWFAHVPGLKVVMPSLAGDARALLLASIFDPDPVIFLEHRWLHNTQVDAADVADAITLGTAARLRSGDAVTVVSASYMTVEALHALDFLAGHGIACDLIDLRTIRPMDWDAITESVRRTGRLLALDTATEMGGIAGEIIAHVTTRQWSDLTAPPRRLTAPDVPEATSPALTRAYHVRAEHIAAAVAEMIGATVDVRPLVEQRTSPHDVPGDWFKGPF